MIGLPASKAKRYKFRLALLSKEQIENKLLFFKEKHYLEFEIKEVDFGFDLFIRLKPQYSSEGLERVLISEFLRIFGDDIYSQGDESIQEVVGYLLLLRQVTVACCESITAGILSNYLTTISGSSSFFRGALIAYQDEVKKNIVKVDERLILEKTSVCKEVAIQMANNIKNIFNSQIGLSTTGIAGPTTIEDLPVGLVYIGIATDKGVCAFKYEFEGTREKIKKLTALWALETLRRELLKI